MSKKTIYSFIFFSFFVHNAQAQGLDFLDENYIGNVENSTRQNNSEISKHSSKKAPSQATQSHSKPSTLNIYTPPTTPEESQLENNRRKNSSNATEDTSAPYTPVDNSKPGSGEVLSRTVTWGERDNRYKYKTISFKIDSRTSVADSEKLNSALTRYMSNGWEVEMTRTSSGTTPAKARTAGVHGSSKVNHVTSYIDYRLRKKR